MNSEGKVRIVQSSTYQIRVIQYLLFLNKSLDLYHEKEKKVYNYDNSPSSMHGEFRIHQFNTNNYIRFFLHLPFLHLYVIYLKIIISIIYILFCNIFKF